MAKTMDPKCYDLAVAFLNDIPIKHKVTDEDRNELGLEIQETIEEFIRELTNEYGEE